MFWLDYGGFGVFNISRVSHEGRNTIVQHEPCPSRHLFILCIFIIFLEYKGIMTYNLKPNYAARATVVPKRRKKIEWLSMIIIAHIVAVTRHRRLQSLLSVGLRVQRDHTDNQKWTVLFFFSLKTVSFYFPLLVTWQWHLPDGRKCSINISMISI